VEPAAKFCSKRSSLIIYSNRTSSLSFLIVSKYSDVNLVRSVAADFDSCGMGVSKTRNTE